MLAHGSLGWMLITFLAIMNALQSKLLAQPNIMLAVPATGRDVLLAGWAKDC